MAARKKTEPAAPESLAEKVAAICGRCWPNGWPHLHLSASCEHGEYSRTDPAGQAPAAEPKQPEQKDPAAETAKTPETPDADPAGQAPAAEPKQPEQS